MPNALAQSSKPISILRYTQIAFSTNTSPPEMFMSQDTSPEYSATWKFLDRRLQDVQTLGKATSEVGDYLDFTAHAVMNVLRSKSVIR